MSLATTKAPTTNQGLSEKSITNNNNTKSIPVCPVSSKGVFKKMSPKVDYHQLNYWSCFFRRIEKKLLEEHLKNIEAKIIAPGVDSFRDTLRAAAINVLDEIKNPENVKAVICETCNEVSDRKDNFCSRCRDQWWNEMSSQSFRAPVTRQDYSY